MVAICDLVTGIISCGHQNTSKNFKYFCQMSPYKRERRLSWRADFLRAPKNKKNFKYFCQMSPHKSDAVCP